jgi:type I restriction enzyme S subunit
VSVNAEDRECKTGEIGVLKVSSVWGGSFIPHNHKAVLPDEMSRVAEPVLGGRIIISRANTPALVGESAYVETAYPELFLPDKLWQSEPSDKPHSVKWLGFYLQCPFVREEISKAATGTSGSMKNIAKPAFLRIPMPLIPLGEQERIAEILTEVTSKVRNLLNQQAHYYTLKRGLMQKLLTGEWRVSLVAHQDTAIAA